MTMMSVHRLIAIMLVTKAPPSEQKNDCVIERYYHPAFISIALDGSISYT